MNQSTLKSGQLDNFVHDSYNEPQAFRYLVQLMEKWSMGILCMLIFRENGDEIIRCDFYKCGICLNQYNILYFPNLSEYFFNSKIFMVYCAQSSQV
jgi:hypothetical protein